MLSFLQILCMGGEHLHLKSKIQLKGEWVKKTCSHFYTNTVALYDKINLGNKCLQRSLIQLQISQVDSQWG